jgi:hypothetical protein
MSNSGWNFPGEDYPPPQSVLVAGKEVKPGDRVCLHPGRWTANVSGREFQAWYA